MNSEGVNVVKRAPSHVQLESYEKSNGFFSFVQDIFQRFALESPWDAWYQFKDTIIQPSALGQALREMSSDIHLSAKYDHAMKMQICDAVFSDEFPQLAYFISRIFEHLQDDKLSEVLTEIFDRAGMAPPLKLVTKLKNLLTLQKIESAIKYRLPLFQDTRHEINCYANMSIHEIESKRAQSLNNIKRTAHHYAITILDHFVNLFSLVFHLKNNTIDEGDPMTAEMQAHMQYTALMQNLSLLSGWVVALSLYLANVAMTAMICGFTALFGGAIVFLYYNYLQPCPENLSPFKNIITEVNKGTVPAVAGREKEIQEVINCLCANDSNTCNHPLLVGSTGVGKTQIVQGLAHRIATGDVPDILKGKKLFIVNTTDLVTGSAWGKLWNLEKVLHMIKGHESEAIFFFDEIHAGFNKEENIDLGQKLKTIMDPGPNKLMCIGATTEKEYTAYIEKDVAFTRRTRRINVHSMSAEETKATLLQRVYDERSRFIVDSAVVEKLAKLNKLPEFEHAAQPYQSMSMLNWALTQAQIPLLTDETIKLTQAYGKRDRLARESRVVLGLPSIPSSPEGVAREEQRQAIMAEIESLEPIVSGQDEERQKMRDLIKANYDIYENCVMDAVRLMDKATDDELKQFILQNHFYRLSVYRQLETKRQEFGGQAPYVVSEAMIDRVIASEISRLKPTKGS